MLNIRWANTIEITDHEAEFLMERQKDKKNFSYKDYNFTKNSISRLSNLLSKEAIKSDEIELEIRKTGVNIDPIKLPNINSKSFKESHPNINFD